MSVSLKFLFGGLLTLQAPRSQVFQGRITWSTNLTLLPDKNGYYGDGTAIGRIPLPDREIYTLYDYRKRIATYRTDLDLLLSHQQFAWIPVWDDHGKSHIEYQ